MVTEYCMPTRALEVNADPAKATDRNAVSTALPLPKFLLPTPFALFGNQWSTSSRGAVQLLFVTLQFVCYKTTL
jgi:hypothetical protein